MALYPWLLFGHIASVGLFLFAHGVSSFAMVRLRHERQIERVRALLLVSKAAQPWMYAGMGVLIGTGVWLGFELDDWSQGWLWAAIAVFAILAVVMGAFGTRRFEALRVAAGIQEPKEGRTEPAADSNDLGVLLERLPSTLLAWIGGVGLALILYLMVFRPF